MFAIIFLLPMNFAVSFGLCSIPKLLKYVYFMSFNIYQANELRFITCATSFTTAQHKIILEQIPLNWSSF